MSSKIVPISPQSQLPTAPKIAMDLEVGDSNSNIVLEWTPPEGTAQEVLDMMADNAVIANMRDTRNPYKQYMHLLLFDPNALPFPKGVFENLAAKKQELERCKEALDAPPCIKNPKVINCMRHSTTMKVRIVFTVIVVGAFIALNVTPEQTLMDHLPVWLIVLAKLVSLLGTGYSAFAPIVAINQQKKEEQNNRRYQELNTEISKILKTEENRVQQMSQLLITDHVEYTPYFHNAPMLRKITVRGLLTSQQKIANCAKSLLLQKMIYTNWPVSRAALTKKMLMVVRNNEDVDFLLRSFNDATKLIELESPTKAARGLDGFRANIINTTGNCMRGCLKDAREEQHKIFKDRLDPPTDVYRQPNNLPPVRLRKAGIKDDKKVDSTRRDSVTSPNSKSGSLKRTSTAAKPNGVNGV